MISSSHLCRKWKWNMSIREQITAIHFRDLPRDATYYLSFQERVRELCVCFGLQPSLTTSEPLTVINRFYFCNTLVTHCFSSQEESKSTELIKGFPQDLLFNRDHLGIEHSADESQSSTLTTTCSSYLTNLLFCLTYLKYTPISYLSE